jgi:hypothetical protein
MTEVDINMHMQAASMLKNFDSERLASYARLTAYRKSPTPKMNSAQCGGTIK